MMLFLAIAIASMGNGAVADDEIACVLNKSGVTAPEMKELNRAGGRATSPATTETRKKLGNAVSTCVALYKWPKEKSEMALEYVVFQSSLNDSLTQISRYKLTRASIERVVSKLTESEKARFESAEGTPADNDKITRLLIGEGAVVKNFSAEEGAALGHATSGALLGLIAIPPLRAKFAGK